MISCANDAFFWQTVGSHAVGRMTHDACTGSRAVEAMNILSLLTSQSRCLFTQSMRPAIW